MDRTGFTHPDLSETEISVSICSLANFRHYIIGAPTPHMLDISQTLCSLSSDRMPSPRGRQLYIEFTGQQTWQSMRPILEEGGEAQGLRSIMGIYCARDGIFSKTKSRQVRTLSPPKVKLIAYFFFLPLTRHLGSRDSGRVSKHSL